MKGRNSFTSDETAQIVSLLRAKERAGRGGQKQLRERLRRRHGFYITDFPDTHRPFRATDFTELVDNGRIKVSG